MHDRRPARCSRHDLTMNRRPLWPHRHAIRFEGRLARMKVEILYFDGCPNWEETADRVRAAASLIGQSDIEIGHRLISSDAEAAASAFAGSPTILVDGVDAFDDAVQLTELACRVYSTDRGLAGLPTVDQLAASLQSKGEALQR